MVDDALMPPDTLEPVIYSPSSPVDPGIYFVPPGLEAPQVDDLDGSSAVWQIQETGKLDVLEIV